MENFAEPLPFKPEFGILLDVGLADTAVRFEPGLPVVALTPGAKGTFFKLPDAVRVGSPISVRS